MSDNASTSQATSPFVPSSTSVGAVMRKVIYALIPGVVLYMILFGWGIVINIILASVSALLFEAIMLMVRGRPLRMFLFDGSAVVTAILLTLALPPMLSWWIPVLGSFFAIVVAKHLYGGLGYNPFNPAMMAYAILLVSFPLQQPETTQQKCAIDPLHTLPTQQTKYRRTRDRFYCLTETYLSA